MIIYPSMKEFKVALFIGRFQPFHKGHLFSLNKCLEMAERVIVGIGSSQESKTENNPWDFETRKKMIESLPVQAGLSGVSRKIQIVAIPDTPTDEEWLRDVVKKVGKFDVVVSHNDWVLSIMKASGYRVFESGLYNRDELEGVKIRELIRNGGEWKNRVPEEVVRQIDVRAVEEFNSF